MERPSALLLRFGRSSRLVRRALVVAVALGVIATIGVILQAVALSSLLALLFHSARASLTHDLVFFAWATLLRAIAVGLGEPVTSRIAAPLRRDLRLRTFGTLMRFGPSGSPDATVQLGTRGVDAIESYLANYVPALVLAILAPTVLLAWLAFRDPLSAIIVLVSVLLLPVFMILFGLAAKEKMNQSWREQQRLAGYFGDVVRGMSVLKSFNRSKHAVMNLEDVGSSLASTTMATLKVAFLSVFSLELLSSLATALVALVLGLRLLNGSLALSVALAVLLVAPEVFVPLRRVSARFHASANGVAAAVELLGYLERSGTAGVILPPDAPPAIELCAIELTHAGRHESSIRPVSAMIGAGSMVGVVGPSGSGKSTLLRMICGLREPISGTVRVDHVELAFLDLEQWQSRVAWLAQDPWLPGRSVREAVTMGAKDIGDDAIRSTMASLGLELDLDRPLGDGSLELSAGERRRLALVRCLVRHPLVLVLDEPTAHLDPVSARLVIRAISQLTMTRIVATHRAFPVDQMITLGITEVNRVG